MQPVSSTRDILIQTERSIEARNFYEGVLGFTVVHDDPAMCGLDTGSFRLFIDTAPALGPVFEFEVGSLSAIKARLLAEGCSIVEEDPSIPRCYMRDPFGLIFNLREQASLSSRASYSDSPTGALTCGRFEDQDLVGAVFKDCALLRSRFENDDLSGSSFSNVSLAHVSFSNVNLTGATIDDAEITGLRIFGHDIQELIRAELNRRRKWMTAY